MINLFITYHCNFHCDYCFVHGFARKYPDSMGEEEFEKLCRWLQKYKISTIGILGGEPTTHPKLLSMLERLGDCGVSPVLFTNGLFDENMREALSELTVNMVFNYNDPSMYTGLQWNKLQNNLDGIRKMGGRISFSKNFSRGRLDYDYLLEAAVRYGITSIRYDISRPNPMEANHYFNLDEARELVQQLTGFVKACELLGLRTGLDCCIPLCYFSEEELSYMRAHSMKFTGICYPSIDIQTDLSASYCIPMREICIEDITSCQGEYGAMEYLSGRVREIRSGIKQKQCVGCDKFMKLCQGGCLALKA